MPHGVGLSSHAPWKPSVCTCSVGGACGPGQHSRPGLTRMWFFPSRSQSLSVLGFTGTTTWCTVSGTESSPFKSTQVGKCIIFSDSFFTSKECKVAEQTITWEQETHICKGHWQERSVNQRAGTETGHPQTRRRQQLPVCSVSPHTPGNPSSLPRVTHRDPKSQSSNLSLKASPYLLLSKERAVFQDIITGGNCFSVSAVIFPSNSKQY